MDITASYEFTRAWLLAHLRVTGDRGSGLVEYGILVVLLAVVCIAAVTLLSRSAQSKPGVSPITTSTVP